MTLTRRRPRAALVPLTAVLATLASCSSMPAGDAGGGDAARTPEVAFHGEQEAFPGFSYDTQYQPAAQPVQVRAVITAMGGTTADARAVATGSSSAPALTGVAGSGRFALDARFRFEIWLKIDLRLGVQRIQYEGRVMNAMVPNVDLAFGGQTTFDPFLIGGTATARAMVPETMVLTVPLAQLAGIPAGVTGDLIVNVGGMIATSFTGACASIRDDGTAQYLARTSASGQILLRPRVELRVASLSRTVGPFEIPVPVEIGERPLDLGPRAASFGPDSLAAMAGGSMAMRGTCSGGPGADGGVPAGDGGPAGMDVTSTHDAVAPPMDAPPVGTDARDTGTDADADAGLCSDGGLFCATDADCCGGLVCSRNTCTPPASAACETSCAGCCMGSTCMPGNTASACGQRGAACLSCPTRSVCNSFGYCEVDPAARFNLRVLSGTVPATNSGGGAWDPFGGNPDPFVIVTNGATTAQTSTASDTTSPSWDAVTLRGVEARALRGMSTRMQVLDDDIDGDDAIGTCTFFVPAAAFGPGYPVQTATGCSGRVTLRYQLQP